MTKQKQYARKVLCLVLTALMCLSVCLLDWSALLPKAEAQSNGNHTFRIYLNVNNSDGDANGPSFTIANVGSWSGNARNEGDQYSGNFSSSNWPGSVSASCSTKNPNIGFSWVCQVYNNTNSQWVTIASGSWSDTRGKNGTKNRDASYSVNPSTSGTPSVSSIEWTTNNTSVTVPTSGTATLSNTAEQKDQYGVLWGGNPTYSLSTSATGISVASSSGTGTVSVTNSAKDWVSNNKDGTTTSRTMTLTATSSSNSKTCTKTITFTNCQYYLDVNGYVTNEYPLNYADAGNISGYGTVDVKNRGSVVANDVNDYYTALYYGTSYSIEDRKDVTGMVYDGLKSGSAALSGKITGATNVVLQYHKAYSTLNVQPNSGTWNGSTSNQSFTQVYNSTKDIPLPTKSGWTFTGWTKSSTFYGSGFNANAAFTYTFAVNNNVSSTITAMWKRDITNTYHYYAADATTDQTKTKSGTALNTATTWDIASPASSEVVGTVGKNDKTWTLIGWNESDSVVWGPAGQSAEVTVGNNATVATTSSAHTFYPVYALATTKFYANFHYYADEATSYSDYIKDKTVEGDAATGAMPVAPVTDDGAYIDEIPTIPRYYTKAGIVYELQGWAKKAADAAEGIVDVAYNGATITLNVPGATTTAPTTSDANLTPIELYPVYTQFATAIHVHFNYYDAGGNYTFLDVSGRALGSNTSGDVKFPDVSNVTASYDVSYPTGTVTYTLVGWSEANNSEDYAPFNTTVTKNVLGTPATDYYTYYPVYSCTTTSTYYYYTSGGAQASLDKTSMLLKTDTNTPRATNVDVPIAGFNKTITLDGRTFTWCGWRKVAASAAPDIATTVTAENHDIRNDPYLYYAIYSNADLALSYNTTHDGVTATPTPATQKQTQYISAGTAATASTDNATELTYTIAPNGEVPEKTGYTFVGWDLSDSEEESATYDNGDTIAIKVDTTLYARFSVNTQNVTFVYYDVTAEGGIDSGYKNLQKTVSYDDLSRDDSATNGRYVVTAPTVKVVTQFVNSSNIAHASDKYHYVFKAWVRSDGKGVNTENTTDAGDYTATFKNVTEDITVQATYNAYPHHYTNMNASQFAAAGITGDTAPSKEATCTEDGYQYMICSDCGHAYKKPILKLDHKDKDGNIQRIYSGYKAPTCTEAGTYFIASCKFCGEVVMTGYGETPHPVYYDYVDGAYVEVDSTDGVIRAIGHNYQYQETVAPTCTEKGYKLYVCANDPSHTEKRDETSFTGHTVVTTEAKEPTCTEDGYTEMKVCSVCNRVILESTIVPALGHEIVKHPAKAVTCLEDGNEEYYECTRCHKYYSDKLGTQEIEDISTLITEAPGSHDYQPTAAAEATCTAPGHTAGSVCSRCGDVEYAENITDPALGHDYQRDVNQSFVSDQPCKTPSYDVFVCSRCGDSYTEDKPLADHTPEDVDAVPATCTTMGKTAYTVCSVCGETITNFSWTPKTEHNYSIVVAEAVAADCTHTGSTASLKCSICGDIKAAEEIPELGHNFGSWVVTTAASCGVAGEKTRYCKRCGTTETEAIDALEHEYEDVAAVEATCYSIGYTAGQRCKNCGATINIDEVQMKPHEMQTVVERAATCTLSGITIKQCVNYAICQHEEEVMTPALGHDYQDDPEVPAVEPTCSDVGYTAGQKCSRCGDEKEPVVIAKVDHDMVEAASVAPTCTEPGMTSYKYCRFCGQHLTDPREIPATGHQYNEQGWILDHARTCTEDGLRIRYCDVEGCPAHTAIIDEEAQTMVLPKLGHNMTKYEAVPAKCGVAGNVEYYVCSRCEGIYYGDEEGNTTLTDIVDPALEHVWAVSETVAPSCTLKGYTIEECIVDGCDATRKVNETDKVPHTGGTATCKDKAVCTVCHQPYGGYADHVYTTEVITEPTCTSQGLKRTTCTVCDKTYDTVIPKSDHKGEVEILVMPTCTEPGTYHEVCKYCGTPLSDEMELAAPGHIDADGDGVCDNCGEPIGTTPSDPGVSNKCDKCGKDHGGKEGGFFGYNGFICRLIAFFRMITKLFSK